MKHKRLIALVLLLGTTAPVLATTWLEERIKDPVSGKDCKVQVPGSFGSYVYQWPEKYDQVFWPLTDPDGVWFCPGSGFATFIGDVALTDDEKSKVAALLARLTSLTEKATHGELLERTEEIYALRRLDVDARARVLRALAYQFQSAGRQSDSDRLRSQAGALMESRLLDRTLPAQLRLQYLFVTANYARERGDTSASDLALAELSRQLAAASSDEKLIEYAEYLKGLIGPAREISPGGLLAPPKDGAAHSHRNER